jgi:hypothetical protein
MHHTTTAGLLLLLVKLASAATTTTTMLAELTTPPPTISGMVVRVKINGVYMNFAGCNISAFGDVACSSDIGHDVTVTPLESTGVQWWVWVLVGLLGLMAAILTAVCLCSMNDKNKKRPDPEEYDPVPSNAEYGRVIGVTIERPAARGA